MKLEKGMCFFFKYLSFSLQKNIVYLKSKQKMFTVDLQNIKFMNDSDKKI